MLRARVREAGERGLGVVGRVRRRQQPGDVGRPAQTVPVGQVVVDPHRRITGDAFRRVLIAELLEQRIGQIGQRAGADGAANVADQLLDRRILRREEPVLRGEIEHVHLADDAAGVVAEPALLGARVQHGAVLDVLSG